MEWNRAHSKKNPQNNSNLSYFHEISEALNPDVKPSIVFVCLVHLPPRWRAEALHTIITSTKQYGTDHIDCNMDP